MSPDTVGLQASFQLAEDHKKCFNFEINQDIFLDTPQPDYDGPSDDYYPK